MDLRITRVGEIRSAFVRLPCRRNVAAHGIRAQEEYVAVASRAQQYSMRSVPFDRAGDQVAGDDPARLSIGDHHIQHFVAVVHLHRAFAHLPHQRTVCAEQQLLARLAARIERTAHLHPAEAPVVEQSTVVAGERNTLRHALIDDVRAYLGKPVYVRLPGAVIATFDRVVKKPVGAVTIVLVVLRGVDPALRSDRVCTARTVLETEGLHIVAEFGQRCCSGSSGQPRAHHDHVDAPFVGRCNDADRVLVLRPFPIERSVGDPTVQIVHLLFQALKNIHTGMSAKKIGNTTARNTLTLRIMGV